MFHFKKKNQPVAYIISNSQAASVVAGCQSYVNGNVNEDQCIGDTNCAGSSVQISSLKVSGKILHRSRIRIGMVAVCFGLVFTGLGVRLMSISFSDEGARRPVFANNRDTIKRPEIMDRNGVLLATNLPTTALEIAGSEVWDVEETVNALASVVKGVDEQALKVKLARKMYVEVRSDLTPREQADVFALGLPGVRFSKRDHRYYPQESLATHLIGHVEKGQTSIGNGGIMGLEKVLDRRSNNEPLISSIDMRAQQALEEVLSEKITEFSAEAGWGGVMDVRTGEMIAMASFPEFNLNDPGAASHDARRNRMTYDRYDLGSAFKVITAASVLEAGLGDEDTPYDARKGLYVSGVTIKDYHGKNRILSLSEVIQYSSNIGVALMAQQLGPKRQKEYLSKLGFFESLPIELAENRSPDLPKKWGPVESATVSYGHGIAVTPLHLLAGFGAVINDGIYRVPTFLKHDEDDLGDKIRDGKRVFSTQTTAKMRRIMRRTVKDGTAKRSEVEGYYPIGKTATADKIATTGGYLKNARISSFVGAFPGYDPRYAILISLDNPQPTKDTFGYATAGWTAAPAFQKLVTRLGPILNVPIVDKAVALRKFIEEPEAEILVSDKNKTEDLMEDAIAKALATTNENGDQRRDTQDSELTVPSVQKVMTGEE